MIVKMRGLKPLVILSQGSVCIHLRLREKLKKKFALKLHMQRSANNIAEENEMYLEQ